MSETIATICNPYLSSAPMIARHRKITPSSGSMLSAHQKRSDQLDVTHTYDNQGKGQWCDRHPGCETCAVTRGAGRQESTEVSKSRAYSRSVYKRDLTQNIRSAGERSQPCFSRSSRQWTDRETDQETDQHFSFKVYDQPVILHIETF
jgi:hypothetical protein